MVKQWSSNKFKCIPRNTSLFISSVGNMYCYNDMAHNHTLGNVADMSVREAIRLRERTQAEGDLCTNCNMLGRYQGKELLQVAASYFRNQLVARAF